MKPMAKKLVREFGLRLIQVDVDRHPELVRRYSLRGLPVLILTDGGEVVARWNGFRPELEIRDDMIKFLSATCAKAPLLS